MSGINDYARIEFQINGEQAKQKLKELEDRAFKLKNAIAEAALAGDKVELKRLRKDFNDTNKELRQMQSKVVEVENVMRRLDKATPNELNSALKTLKMELNDIERGSAAWDEHTKKIRLLREELKKVKVQQGLSKERTLWQGWTYLAQSLQATLVSLGSIFIGLRSFIYGAVDAFAKMDQEMANVRKFTGMTAAQVEDLNDNFKKMDTRTSREELNKLAGEAGKLGKKSKEDVLGFVKAADKINVALDELGEGATLTLSKLTGIFGDEKRLGTERSLLSIGSAVNELAQNSRAGAPYLVEFASRMGGVGAQAGMTSAQVLGFGAVLDSYNQKVESSSTALSQVMVRIYREPAKYAKVAGLDVKRFAELVKTDMNSAVIELLEALNRAGGMDVLSPMFKDMGENGSRAIQALSTLAEHIDEVKQRQQEATMAFNEATSVTKEFNVQNDTAKAKLEKARKNVNELRVELGAKLMPVMGGLLSGMKYIITAVSILFDFIKSNIGTILSCTAAWVAWKVAVNAQTIAFYAHYTWLVIVEKAQRMLNGVLAVGKVAVLACSVAYNTLTRNTMRAAAAQKLLNSAWNSSVAGAVVTVVVAMATAIFALVKRLTEEHKVLKDLNDMRKSAVSKAQDEILAINLLRKAAQNETLAMEDRLKAVKKLNEISPSFKAEIDKQTGKYREAKRAVDNYVKSLIKQYELEGAKDKLAEIGRQKADLKVEMQKYQNQYEELGNGFWSGKSGLGKFFSHIANSTYSSADVLSAKIEDLRGKLAELGMEERLILQMFGRDLQKQAVNAPGSSDFEEDELPDGKGGGSGSDAGKVEKENKEKFEAEKKWRELEEAAAMLAYANRETDAVQYAQRMRWIEDQYYSEVLSHAELAEDERLKIEAEYAKKRAARADEDRKAMAKRELADFREMSSREKQRYIDGEIDKETYDKALEILEAKHWVLMLQIYEKGTKEYEEVVAKMRDKQLKDKEKADKEAEDKEKKHQEELKKLKEKYFGLNAVENKQEYDAAMKNLKEVYETELDAVGDNAKEKKRIDKAYQEAKFALAKMYNQKIEDDTRSSYLKTIEGIAAWLESDGGKMLTKSLDVLVSGMSEIFSGLTTIVQAELEIQSAAIEKRYEREISAAEGNNYKVKQLEKQKEKELAKAKREANRKAFVMQVIQAIATTAQGAINAYASAAQAPWPMSMVLPPIAASMALAAGAIQIAAIKKQQQASEASGYSAGGFTPAGRVDEEVGVVHAGEWVASQKLLASPKARAIINTLDYAQRTNTIGSLDAEDVSRSITAPAVLAKGASSGEVARSLEAQAMALATYASTMRRLQERLDEPFVTVNTVTGNSGIKKAQDDFEKLMKNKSPKR